MLTDAISKDDIDRVARRLLKSQPCIAARGEIKTVPSLADIQNALLNPQGRLPGFRSKLSLFR